VRGEHSLNWPLENDGKLMRNFWILTTLLLTTIGINVAIANQSEKHLSLLKLPIGEQRESVLSGVERQWGSSATCNTAKTGVGMTRRAYFLETCVFINSSDKTLYDETPVSTTYRFLEGKLVQVSYEFEQVTDPGKLMRCAQKDSAKLEARHKKASDAIQQSIMVADDYQILVSDTDMVAQIHVLRDTL